MITRSVDRPRPRSLFPVAVHVCTRQANRRCADDKTGPVGQNELGSAVARRGLRRPLHERRAAILAILAIRAPNNESRRGIWARRPMKNSCWCILLKTASLADDWPAPMPRRVGLARTGIATRFRPSHGSSVSACWSTTLHGRILSPFRWETDLGPDLNPSPYLAVRGGAPGWLDFLGPGGFEGLGKANYAQAPPGRFERCRDLKRRRPRSLGLQGGPRGPFPAQAVNGLFRPVSSGRQPAGRHATAILRLALDFFISLP